jgi:hypothetical protein
VRASLDAYTANNLSVIGARLILQEEVAFEQGEVWRHDEEDLTHMHKDSDLKNGVRVQMN